MKLRHPWLIRLVGFVVAWIIKIWIGSLRVRVDCRASGKVPHDPRRQRSIYGFWHENLLAATVFKGAVDVLISHHADGELVFQIIRHLNLGAVRGSSTRGGSAALLNILRTGKRRHILVTPDGPRGPRRRIQPGLVFLASRTGLPIVVAAAGYDKAWRARSWDRLAVPLPFSLATWVVSEPMYVPPGVRGAELEAYRLRVEQRLELLTEDAERWATGRPRLRWRESRPAMMARSA